MLKLKRRKLKRTSERKNNLIDPLGSNKDFAGFANAFIMKTVEGLRNTKALITTHKMTTSFTDY